MSKCKEYKWALGFAVLTGMMAPAAVAQDDDPEWYFGGNFGRTQAGFDTDQISRTLLESGLTTTTIEENRKDSGFKALAGIELNRNFALEMSYYDLGYFRFTADTLPPGTLTGTLKAKGIALDLVGLLPLSERWSLMGRLGAHNAKVKDTFRGTGAVNALTPSEDWRGSKIKAGAGLQFDFSQKVAMRLEAERYRINDAVGNKADIDMYSLGLVYKMGAESSSGSRAAATQTEPAPVRSPVVVLAPVTSAQTQEYCSILDLQFEINSDDIQRSDAEKLLVLATFLQKYPDTTALIEGHTDNVGSADANLSLSRNRADNVVSHMIASHDIAASRLTAVGHGASRPLADNSTEAGRRMNRRTGAVIACASDVAGLETLPARMAMALLIEFDRDQSQVKDQYRQSLSNVADYLRANPGVNAVIEGHTDNSTQGNSMQVSRMRAQSVADYLVANFSVPRSRLETQGFGQERRFAYNTMLEGRQENRRVNIIFEYPPR